MKVRVRVRVELEEVKVKTRYQKDYVAALSETGKREYLMLEKQWMLRRKSGGEWGCGFPPTL
jgi:hypothetical protein